MSNCHDGRVVYMSMSPTLFQRCMVRLLITTCAVYISHTFTKLCTNTRAHSTVSSSQSIDKDDTVFGICDVICLLKSVYTVF